MAYPQNFLRGISNNNFIIDDIPSSDLFYFKKDQQQELRPDNNIEVSINWLDDEDSIKVLFSQKKGDHIQFKSGAALLSRIDLDRLIKKPQYKEILSYERKVLDNNKYHGNLLMKDSVDKKKMKMIAAAIAVSCFIEIIPNYILDDN